MSSAARGCWGAGNGGGWPEDSPPQTLLVAQGDTAESCTPVRGDTEGTQPSLAPNCPDTCPDMDAGWHRPLLLPTDGAWNSA